MHYTLNMSFVHNYCRLFCKICIFAIVVVEGNDSISSYTVTMDKLPVYDGNIIICRRFHEWYTRNLLFCRFWRWLRRWKHLRTSIYEYGQEYNNTFASVWRGTLRRQSQSWFQAHTNHRPGQYELDTLLVVLSTAVGMNSFSTALLSRTLDVMPCLFGWL